MSHRARLAPFLLAALSLAGCTSAVGPGPVDGANPGLDATSTTDTRPAVDALATPDADGGITARDATPPPPDGSTAPPDADSAVTVRDATPAPDAPADVAVAPPDALPDAAPAACTSNSDCAAESQCHFAPGCGATGVCDTTGCGDAVTPFCGCDGVTIQSPDTCAHQPFAYAGACAVDAGAPGCFSDFDCSPDGTTVCRYLTADCGATAGTCVPNGPLCDGPDSAYCGCDAMTFFVTCGDRPAGRWASAGPCESADAGSRPCTSRADCAAGDACVFEPGCGVTSGTCRLEPDCDGVPQPYCACDGVTFIGGPYCAGGPGFAYAHAGECADAGAPGCSTSAECGLGEQCLGDAGCGAAWSCQVANCTRDLVSYCGCDGATFEASSTCPGRHYQHTGACAP